MSKLKSIPSAALDALKEAGISDVMVMLCIDADGKIHQLKGDGVTDNKRDPAHPITTTATGIQTITISMIEHVDQTTKSTATAAKAAATICKTIIIGGVPVTFCK
jgi:hypothetical protein